MPNEKDAKPSGNKWAIMGGIALNVEYTRKYAFEATAAARVTAKLVAIPPPVAFQEAIQADLAGRQKRALQPAAPPPSPGTSGGSAPVLTPPGPSGGSGPAPFSPGASGGIAPVLTPPGTRADLEPEVPSSLEEAAPVEFEESIWVDQDEIFSLFVPDAAGVEYILDDGLNPPAVGLVSAAGVLQHPIASQAESVTISFANRSEPVIFRIDHSTEDELDDLFEDEDLVEDADLFADEEGAKDEEEDEGWAEDEAENDVEAQDEELDEIRLGELRDDTDWDTEQTAEGISLLSTEDDTPTLSLLVPDRANQSFTLDDGINPPGDGVVDASGWLVHPISPEATGAVLRFGDETEAIQLTFTSE